MAPPRKVRPTLADLEHDGPPLSPADFGLIIGLPRETIAEMCRVGEIQAFTIGTGQHRRRWKIARPVALAYCVKIGMKKPAA